MTKKELDALTYKVIGAAIEINKLIGPGLLESVYQKCLKHELIQRKIIFAEQLLVPIDYKGVKLETEFRCDFLVENSLVVELKSINAIAPVHEAQLLTYMKLLNCPKGILINFNCTNIFKEGQKTLVNELYKNLPDE